MGYPVIARKLSAFFLGLPHTGHRRLAYNQRVCSLSIAVIER